MATLTEEQHGLSGYRYGCKCPECLSEGRAYARDYFHAHARRHGLTSADKSAALKAVGWACQACGEAFVAASDAQVDHDHECCPGSASCGRCIRGLLCGPCNGALGIARDDLGRLRALVAYLESVPRLARVDVRV